MHQLDLASSGEALFKIRGKFLKYTILVGVVVAYFHAAIGPFDSAGANQIGSESRSRLPSEGRWFGLSPAATRLWELRASPRMPRWQPS